MTVDGAVDAAALPFGLYAEVYDLIYRDKDYAAESAFIVELVRRFLPAQARTGRLIDLACGTGRHAIALAQAGYQVTGSDISEQMVAIARQAVAKEGVRIPLHVQSFQSCDRIGGQYDVALAMFSSLGYLVTARDVDAALSGVRALLRPGGVFVFDVWNGLAAITDYSPVRVKRAAGASTNVVRISRTVLDQVAQVARVTFEFLVYAKDRAPIEFSEEHLVRFYFPRELAELLESRGFEVLLQCPFMNAGRPLTPTDWNMTFVARNR